MDACRAKVEWSLVGGKPAKQPSLFVSSDLLKAASNMYLSSYILRLHTIIR